jgi:hypothetical protein
MISPPSIALIAARFGPPSLRAKQSISRQRRAPAWIASLSLAMTGWR